MADNTVLNAGTGGDTIASDDIGGVKYQRVKLGIGADGAASDAIPVSNGLDTTAAGVQAVGVVAQLDDTSTGAVTENQFAPVRMSSRRAILTERVAVSRSDTYTTTASGTTVNVAAIGKSSFGIQVKGTGAAASVWAVALEVSLDGTNFAVLETHSSADGDTDGSIIWSSLDTPALYFRSRCTSVTLGSATDIIATIIGA